MIKPSKGTLDRLII